ncbi:MAG: hypothetical protein JSV49_07970 [Thermoplasmata archaeon]|nr:MAG: hypothetical protein JSV49_07970 [Thermoplasmata archaeon]
MKKVIILGFAVLVVGLLVMPNTVAMFKNQHTFQQTEDVKCTSCHDDIRMNLESSENYHHDAASLGVSDTEEVCKYCHQTQFGDDYGSTGNWSGESGASRVHGAFTVECLDCHGGSNLNDDPNAVDIINEFNSSSIEAHLPLYTSAVSSDLMEGANEACIACHTGISIQNKGYFVVNKGMNLTAEHNNEYWVITFTLYNP